MSLFLACYLSLQRQKVIIPANYVYKLNFAKTFNNRINRNQDHLIFYSNNLLDVPKFTLTTSEDFDEHQTGCYKARLLKAFGKFSFFIDKNLKIVLKCLRESLLHSFCQILFHFDALHCFVVVIAFVFNIQT